MPIKLARIAPIASKTVFTRGVPGTTWDLNRAYPGSATGDTGERITARITEEARKADAALDVHTAAWCMPYILIDPVADPVGLAVYAESDSSKGWGRLGQSGFEGMMRAEIGRGPVSLREIHADGRGFPHNRDYLYGSYFFLFLSEHCLDLRFLNNIRINFVLSANIYF